MAMYCIHCRRNYEQHVDCPACGARLHYQAQAIDPDTSTWQQTPWGRMLVGLLLAQGLAHGLHMLTTAGLLASGEALGSAMATPAGFLFLQLLQAVGLMIGGIVTGAGRERGVLFGSFVGLVNALIFLLIQINRGEHLSEAALFSVPVLHVFFGAAGALVGTTIWKPLPRVRAESIPADNSVAKLLAQPTANILAGPVSWPRVIAGTAIVVCGVVRARAILQFILDFGEGNLSVTTHAQHDLVIWEISAIMAFIGAGLAGATTTNGIKQGLFVGIAAGIILAGIHMGNPRVVLNSNPVLMASIWCLTMAGGWFGCQLFPPVYALPRRQRFSLK